MALLLTPGAFGGADAGPPSIPRALAKGAAAVHPEPGPAVDPRAGPDGPEQAAGSEISTEEEEAAEG